MPARKPASAATLVELLVVVSVISVLTGLLLPAVEQSRSAARRAGCQSNLRQWTLAVLRYADDHRGYLPRRGQGVQPTERFDRREDWFNALPPYLDELPLVALRGADKAAQPWGVWRCPELPPADKPQYFAYGMNMWLSTWKSSKPDKLATVGATSSMVFLADGPGTQCSLLPSDKPYSPIARHDGVTNVAFLDGHVAAIAGDVLGCGIGLIEDEAIRWRVPESVWAGPDSD